MNPRSPREELEIRITALLMGELSPDEAAALRTQIAADTELSALHARLQRAAGLLREANVFDEKSGQPAQLSAGRRAKLLAHFKGGAPASQQAVLVKPKRDWKWAVPLGLAASLMALIGGALFVNTFGLRKSSRISSATALSFDSDGEGFKDMGEDESLERLSNGRTVDDDHLGSKSDPGARNLESLARELDESRGRNFRNSTALSLTPHPTSDRPSVSSEPLKSSRSDLAAKSPNASTMSRDGFLYLPSSAGETKSGSGTVTISGTNTYHGTTTVNGGVLQRFKEDNSSDKAMAQRDDRDFEAPSVGRKVSGVVSGLGSLTDPSGPARTGPLGGESSVTPPKPAASEELNLRTGTTTEIPDARSTGPVDGTPSTPPAFVARGDLGREGTSDMKRTEEAQKEISSHRPTSIFGDSVHFDSAIQTPLATPATPAAPEPTTLVAQEGRTSPQKAKSLEHSVDDRIAWDPPVSGKPADAGHDKGDATTWAARNQIGDGDANPKLDINGVVDKAETNYKLQPHGPAPAAESVDDLGRRTTGSTSGKYQLNATNSFAGGTGQVAQAPEPIPAPSVPLTSGNRSGSAAISADAVDALLAGTAKNAPPAGGGGVMVDWYMRNRNEDLDGKYNANREGEDVTTLGSLRPKDTIARHESGLASDDWRDAEKKSPDAPKAISPAPETQPPVLGDIPLPLLGRLFGKGTKDEKPAASPQPESTAPVQEKVKAEEKSIDESDREKLDTGKPAPNSLVPQPEVRTAENPFSTFSLNVSDVAFKLAAASLEHGTMPDVSTLRTEEFINAFDYRDPEPAAGAPLAFTSERARYPFAQNRDVIRFSVKTAAAGRQPGKPLNVVLVLDNSGSMERADRVRIVREGLRVLAAQLHPQDRLSIVTFARTPHLWADGVAGDKAGKVTARVAEITPEGGTNLGAALDLGYATAMRHYQTGSINHVVLLTDGAANLGDVDPAALKQKVEAHRKQGIALDCFGIGWDGLNDDMLEQLSRNGDGRYGFINTPEEAATNFAAQLAGALRVAASDVKVQVEWNPKRVTAYRQVGYAKHQLTKEQFRDNTVDAAELAAAESGNALYVVEVDPRGEGDLATVRVRFKVPDTSDYREHEWPVPFTHSAVPLEESGSSLRLAATAAAFCEMLAGSPFATEVTSDRLLGLLSGVPAINGADSRPKKLEWMIRQAHNLSGR